MSNWTRYKEDTYNNEGDLVLALTKSTVTSIILRWTFCTCYARYDWVDFYDWLSEPLYAEQETYTPEYILDLVLPECIKDDWKTEWQ